MTSCVNINGTWSILTIKKFQIIIKVLGITLVFGVCLLDPKKLQIDQNIPREKVVNVPLHTKDVNVKGVEVYKLAQET